MADAAGAITNGFMAAFAYLVILNLWNNKYSKAKSLNFEGIVSSLQKVKLVSLNKLKWTSSKCSCAFYLKNYFCYHIVAVAVQEDLKTIPHRYQTKKIATKKKR